MKSMAGSWCSSSSACCGGELHHARVVWLQGCTSSRAVALFQLLGCACVNSLAEGLVGFDPQRKQDGEKHYWSDEGATLPSHLILWRWIDDSRAVNMMQQGLFFALLPEVLATGCWQIQTYRGQPHIRRVKWPAFRVPEVEVDYEDRLSWEAMLMVTGCSSFFPAVSPKHGSSHSFVVPTQVYLQLLTEFLKLVDLTGWLHAS